MLVGDVCYDMFGMLYDCWLDGCWLYCMCWLGGCWLFMSLIVCLWVFGLLLVMYMRSIGDVCGCYCSIGW